MLKKLSSFHCSSCIKKVSKILAAVVLINISCLNLNSLAENENSFATKNNAATLKEVQFVDGKYMDGDTEVFNVITMYDTKNEPHYYLVTLNKTEYVQKSLSEGMPSSKIYFNFEKPEGKEHYVVSTSLEPSNDTISYEYKNEYGNKSQDTSTQEKKYFKWDTADGYLKLKFGYAEDYDLVYYVDKERKAGDKTVNPSEVNKDYYNVYYTKDMTTAKDNSEYGGAIYNNNNEISHINGDFIRNRIISEGTISQYNRYIVGGGAVANDVNGVIGDIKGFFIQNYASTEDEKGGNTSGGAITNMGTIGKITGDFIGNYLLSNATTNNTFINGGAIANGVQTYYSRDEGTEITAQINGIEGTFIGNYINAKRDAQGGAISSAGTILGNIEGDFTGNYASSYSNGAFGGAIFNEGYIKQNIIGNFIGNYAKSESTNRRSANGGAILNYAKGKIGGSIQGDFIGNYAEGSTGSAYGGAIHNDSDASIEGNIEGNFIGNYAISEENTAQGGAIFNHWGTIGKKDEEGNITGGNIIGDFIGNYAKQTKTGGTLTEGGAIYNNEGTIYGSIKGDFINNYVYMTQADAEDHDAEGGAIYNYGNIGDKTLKGSGNIQGDFTGNYAIANGVATLGGAIYNYGKIYGNIESNFTNNKVLSDNEWAAGAGIFNAGTIGTTDVSETGNIRGNFIGNTATSTSGGAYGAAIYNSRDITGNIRSNFIGNTATSTSGGAYGAAIYNTRNITGNIKGDYINNKAMSSNANSYAGAIYNGGTIGNSSISGTGNIEGNFTGNSVTTNGNKAYACGGSIYNAGSGRIIGNIKGDYINNKAMSSNYYSYGGAIYNGGTIGSSSILDTGNIEGNFTENTSVSDNFYAQGGAIYNSKAIYGNINGNFTKNGANSTWSRGGAIFNKGTIGKSIDGTVSDGNIKGDFSNNYLISSQHYSLGGAIYNEGTILGSIEGKYTGNNIVSDANYAYGGAIYNKGSINEIKNSSFYDNYAESTSASNAHGGAIYSTKDLNIIADNGKTSEFKGNYTLNGTVKDNNAIYMDTADSNINLTANENGKIIFHDNISGASEGYNINLSSDGTGEISFYDNLYNANITATNVTANFKYNDGKINNHEIKSVNFDGNSTVKLALDVDLDKDTPLSDVISPVNTSSGIIYIDDINYISDSAENKTVKVLNLTDDSALTLALSQAIIDKYNTGKVLIKSEEISKTIISVAPSAFADLKNIKWDDDIQTDVTYELVSEDTYTQKGISVSKDSIIFENKGDNIIESKTQNVTESSKYDTLAYVNQLSNGTEEKNFNFDSAENTYKATADIGKSASGILNINGVSNEDNKKSTIDLNEKNGFELSDKTTLNINNTELKNGKDNTLITVSNSNVDINLSNTAINGNIVADSDVNYNLNIIGNTSINGSVGNANATLNKEDAVLSFAKDTFKDASLTADKGTISFSDGKTNEYNIGNLISSENTKYAIDVDLDKDTASSDVIFVGNNSSGTIIIDNINYISGLKTGESKSVKVLDNSSGSAISLAVSDAVQNNKVLTNKEILSSNNENIDAAVETSVNWQDKTSDKIKTTTEIKETYTENSVVVSDSGDSLVITGNGTITEEKTETSYTDVKTYDTLAFLNKEDKGSVEKKFNFDSANDVYKASEDMGVSAENNTLSVNGFSDEKGNKSTIDLNGYKGFELSHASTLNINNTKLKNGKNNTLITVSDKEAKVNIANGIMEGNIDSSNEYALNISGDTVINGTVGQANVQLNNTNLALSSDNVFNNLNVNIMSESTLNYANNNTSAIKFGELNLNSNLNMILDANLAKKEMDTISLNSFNPNGNKINISKINILEPTTDKAFSISPIGNISDSTVKTALSNAITYTGGEMVYSPIYKYNALYDANTGLMNFSMLGGGNNSESYNPAIMAAPTAA